MRSDRALTCVAVAALAAAVLVACSSTVTGSGSAVRPSSSAPSTPASSSGVSTDVPTTTDTSSATPGPTAVPPPASCPGGTCPKSLSATLSSPYTIVVRANRDYSGGVGATIVELTNGTVPVFWYTIEGDSPSQLSCITGSSGANCVLVDYTGAHASNATVWTLAAGTLHRGATVTSDTPNMRADDLNGDGFVDAEALQNTYVPDYASGSVYWQTWTSDGSHLTSTGCSAPTHNPPAAPTAPLSGSCP